MSADRNLSILELEYSEINANIRSLADVRFKLLALIPFLGGVAAFILSTIGLAAGKEMSFSTASATLTPTSDPLLAAFASAFGFVVSLGIVIYDQRNSELYNALIHRAKHLETKFGVGRSPGSLIKKEPTRGLAGHSLSGHPSCGGCYG